MPTSTQLQTVARAYRDRLTDSGTLTEFPLTGYDRTGIPVVAAVWDDDDGGDAHGVGYGRSQEAAAVGALGEVAERVFTQQALRDVTVVKGSYHELVGRRGSTAVADPVALIMDAGADYSPEQPLTWVSAVRWRTGEEVLVPSEFAAFDHASMPPAARRPGRLITPITNGMGAGDTVERAVGHGLLELVQRDGDNVVFRALDRGDVIDLSGAVDQAVTTVLDTLRGAGIEPVVKLASTEFACVVYCVGDDHDPAASPIALSAIGEAAHPDRNVAVSKALLEFASSRARRNFAFGPLADVARLSPGYWAQEQRRPSGAQEARALQAMSEWTQWELPRMRAALAPLFARVHTVPLESLPTQPATTPADLLRLLLDRLADFDVLVVPAPDHDTGMVAVKVLAAGLEVETLSYLRIGERAYRSLLEQDRGLVGPGPPNRPGRIAVRLTDAARDRVGGPIWIDATAAAATVGTLYPLYREPRRHAVQRAREPVR